MKSRPLRLPALLAILAASVLFTPLLTAQNTAQQRYNEGVKLFNQGNYAEALTHFDAVLRAQPNFVYARSYAARCRKAIAENAGPQNNLEAKLAKIVFPEVNLSETPLGDVLDYLAARALELTGGQTTVNFIYKGSVELRDETKISLSLRNVPMSEIVKYVGQMSRTRVRYEPHAVVLDPGAPAPEKDEPEETAAAGAAFP